VLIIRRSNCIIQHLVSSHSELIEIVNPLEPELFFFNFSTLCIQNVNNTGTEQVSIMKQTAF